MSIYRSADIDIDAVIAKMACIKAEGWAAAVLHFENTARNLWTDVIIFWQSANNAIELRRILNAENTIYRSLRSKPWKGDLWGSRMRIYPKIFWLAPCQLMVALRLDSLPKILRPHPNCQKKKHGCPTVYEVRFDWTAGESNHNLCSLFVTCTTVVYGEFEGGPTSFCAQGPKW